MNPTLLGRPALYATGSCTQRVVPDAGSSAATKPSGVTV